MFVILSYYINHIVHTSKLCTNAFDLYIYIYWKICSIYIYMCVCIFKKRREKTQKGRETIAAAKFWSIPLESGLGPGLGQAPSGDLARLCYPSLKRFCFFYTIYLLNCQALNIESWSMIWFPRSICLIYECDANFMLNYSLIWIGLVVPCDVGCSLSPLFMISLIQVLFFLHTALHTAFNPLDY